MKEANAEEIKFIEKTLGIWRILKTFYHWDWKINFVFLF